MTELENKLGETGVAELKELIRQATAPKTVEWITWLKGAIKSRLNWFGALLLALPEILTHLSPDLVSLLGDNGYATLMRIAGVVVILLRFDTTKSLLDKGKQSGFARIGMLVLLAALSAGMAGCGGFMEVKPIHETQRELTPLEQAQVGLNELRGTLAGFNVTIEQNVRERIWTKTQAQGYLDESKALRKRVDQAQTLLNAGDITNAEAQRKLITEAVFALQRRAAAAARGEGT